MATVNPMKLVSLEQNSPEWVVWRRGGLGASDAAAVVGLSPWVSRARLLHEKRAPLTGKGDRENSAMRRGKRLEPEVRKMYEDLMGWSSPAVCVLHGEYDWIRASYDGWNAEVKVGLEIKCPSRDDHEQALAGKVPMKYLPQLHHQMLIAAEGGAREWHYVSYNDYLPVRYRFALVRVKPDRELEELLLAAEMEFWDEVHHQNVDRTGDD